MHKIQTCFFKKNENDFKNYIEQSEFIEENWPFSLWTLNDIFLKNTLKSNAILPNIKKTIEEFLREPKAHLKNDKGCCYVLFRQNKNSIFNSACALPLQWRQTENEDPCLPESLSKLAKQILDQVESQYSLKKKNTSWNLWLNFSQEECDLSMLDDDILSAESGWASLTASLILSIHNGTPNHEIWATGAWNNNELKEVEFIEEKLKLVKKFGGKMFFVPESRNEYQALKCKENQDIDLKINSLPSGKENISEVLEKFLTQLHVRPEKGASLESRKEYYNIQCEFNNKEANIYYEKFMQKDLAKECISKMEIDINNTKNLVSFISFNPSYRFVLYAIRPKNLLLFYTKETEKQKEEMLTVLQQENSEINIQEEFYDNDDSKTKMKKTIQYFANKHSSHTTALDVTPGPKDFSLPAAWSLFKHKSQFFYLSHDYNPKTKSYQPGDEKIQLLHS